MDPVERVCKSCQDNSHGDCVNQWIHDDHPLGPCGCGCTPQVRDLPEGLRRKAEGIQQALYGSVAYKVAKAGYRCDFEAAARRVGPKKEWITSEDITALCGQPEERGLHPNCVGANMNRLATMALVEKLDGPRVPAQRPNQHGAQLDRWRWIG